MNWFTDKLYDLGASPRAGEGAWGELAAQDAMPPRVKANYYEGIEMPRDPRARDGRYYSSPRMGSVAEPGIADFMLPPSYEPPTGPQPVQRRLSDYPMSHTARMNDYQEMPADYWRQYDKATAPSLVQQLHEAGDVEKLGPELRGKLFTDDLRARQRAADPAVYRQGAAPRPGPLAPEGSLDTPILTALNPALEMYLPNDPGPLDVGLTVAGGPVGGKLLRGGAAVLGALFQSDEAEAGVLSRVGKVLGGKPGGPGRIQAAGPSKFNVVDDFGIQAGPFATLEDARNALNVPKPTYNYVVTDPSKLDILAKYGIVGTAAGGTGALAAQDRYRGAP